MSMQIETLRRQVNKKFLHAQIIQQIESERYIKQKRLKNTFCDARSFW